MHIFCSFTVNIAKVSVNRLVGTIVVFHTVFTMLWNIYNISLPNLKYVQHVRIVVVLVREVGVSNHFKIYERRLDLIIRFNWSTTCNGLDNPAFVDRICWRKKIVSTIVVLSVSTFWRVMNGERYLDLWNTLPMLLEDILLTKGYKK